MFQSSATDAINSHIQQVEKEKYIVDMLTHTLYSNDINDTEKYRIVNQFYNTVLNYKEISANFTSNAETYLKSISESLSKIAKAM